MHVAGRVGVICKFVRSMGRGNYRRSHSIRRLAPSTRICVGLGRGAAWAGGGPTVSAPVRTVALGLMPTTLPISRFPAES